MPQLCLLLDTTDRYPVTAHVALFAPALGGLLVQVLSLNFIAAIEALVVSGQNLESNTVSLQVL